MSDMVSVPKADLERLQNIVKESATKISEIKKNWKKVSVLAAGFSEDADAISIVLQMIEDEKKMSELVEASKNIDKILWEGK
jgi:uncharacterized protein with PhoU and TrkA domain